MKINGRPTKFNKGVLDKLKEYIKFCEDNGEIPTMEYFAFKLGVNKDTIQEWKHKHKSFSVSLKNMLEFQSHLIQTKGLSGKYNAPMAIFLLKNNHGFKDRQETDITTNGKDLPLPITSISTDVKK